MKTLVQKSLGRKTEFALLKDRVVVKSSSWNKSLEYPIRYEEIGFDIVRKKTKPVLWLLPFSIILVSLEIYVLVDEYQKGVRFPELLFWLFAVIFFGALGVMSFFQRSDKIYLTGGNHTIELDAGNPDENRVNLFINTLHESIRNFYRKKFAFVDENQSAEVSIQRFRWLLEIAAISDEEYENLIGELERKRLL